MSELSQNSSLADMCLEGVLLTPRVTEMYDDVLENTVYGAAYDIRDMLAVNFLRKGTAINKQLFDKFIDYHKNPDHSISDWVAEAPQRRVAAASAYHTETYVKFMLAQAGNDLGRGLDNLMRANDVANHGKKIKYEEVIDGAVEAAQADMLNVFDPREQVAMNLLSLGIGDNITFLYGSLDNNRDTYFDQENELQISDYQLENGAYPVTPTVPFLLSEEEVRKILPASCQEQFAEGDSIDGYAILHGNILYMFRHSFIGSNEKGQPCRIHPVFARIMTDEGVEGIYLMAVESR